MQKHTDSSMTTENFYEQEGDQDLDFEKHEQLEKIKSFVSRHDHEIETTRESNPFYYKKLLDDILINVQTRREETIKWNTAHCMQEE